MSVGDATGRGDAGGRRRKDVAPLVPTSFSTSRIRDTLPVGMQRVGPLSEIPALLEEHGVAPAEVLARAGLGSHTLADREARIPFAACGRLLQVSAEATGRPDFALLAASRWRLEHIGLVGELMASCATLGQALECFASFQWMNASGGAVFFRRDGDVNTFGYAIYEPGMTVGIEHAYDLVMGIGTQMLRELTGSSRWAPLRVQLARPRPADAEPYRRYFRAPVQFNAGATLLQFPAGSDAMSLKSRNDERRRELLAMTRGRREDVLQKLRRAARLALMFGLSAEELAVSMHMSPRTLNRRVSEQGSTLREILGQVRFEVAQQLLRDTTMPVTEIASSLGYGDTSAFVRAFRRWSNTSPQSWRRAAAPQWHGSRERAGALSAETLLDRSPEAAASRRHDH